MDNLTGTTKNRYRFPKEEKLKKRNDIKAVFGIKKGLTCRGLKLLAKKNNLTRNRIAFTFPKNFGNAVQRNRSKRVSKEAYRYLKHQLIQGWDFIIITYPDSKKIKSNFFF